MKAKEVLTLLGISRSTLCKYVKQGKIKAKQLPSGRYEYDDDSVYALLGKGQTRKDVIYARVFSLNQEAELKKQVELINQYCLAKGITVGDVYEDIGSGLDFNRPAFRRLITEVLAYRIKRVFVLYKDRFCPFCFDFLSDIFKHFGTQIVVLNEKSNFSSSEKEVYQEAIYFLGYLSQNLISPTRKERFDLIKKSLKLELIED